MTKLEVKAKTSVWQTPVKLSPMGMFKAVGKLFAAGAKQDLRGAGHAMLDIVASVELEDDAGAQAGLLVTRALGRALLRLIDPYKMGFDEAVAADALGIAAAIDAELEATQLVLDRRFLEHPRELAIVASFAAQIERWLEPVDLRGRDPRSIAARLPEHFVYALHEETIERRGDYDALFASFAGEFDDAYRRERSWAGYRAWFRRELAGPVLGDTFSLPQVFVWPRAYFIADDDGRAKRGRLAAPEHERQRRELGWLRETLDAWLGAADRHDAVRVISGDPGSGKSSFARMYAGHRMDLGDRVLYVPLHLLDVQGDLSRSLARLCDEIHAFPVLSLDGDDAERELLMIFDGLDELAKRGHVGARLAEEFVTEVQAKVDKHNYGGLRLRALLCGRPIAVQGVRARFRRPEQILHLLPYTLTEAERADEAVEWVDTEADLLARDQRGEWWRRYALATGAAESEFPEVLRSDELTETTRQPLLGYLLALVYEGARREGKQLDRDISRNEIYAQLIDRVYEREWGSRRGHPVLSNMSREEFRELLEDMALAAWHDGERVTTVEAVEALQGGEHQVARLRAYAEDCDGVGQLFTAFYMRKRGERHGGEETFEFTHKSFAEYLTASRLVAQVELTAAELEPRGQAGRSGRWAIKGFRELLVDWLGVFGPVAISHDLLPYLRREVALREAETPGVAKRWQAALIGVINYVLREGSPCERLDPPLRFTEARSYARNAEEALLALLSCCALVTEELSVIDWPNSRAFGDWIRWLRDQPNRRYEYRTIAGRCLAYLDLRNLQLAAIDLSFARMMHTNLAGADLDYANLGFANLSDVELGDATLNFANLNSARMVNAQCARAQFHFASMFTTDLWSANLEQAIFKHANLVSANLSHTDLRGANLSDATLKSANLDGAQLGGSNITPKQLAWTLGTPASVPDASE